MSVICSWKRSPFISFFLILIILLIIIHYAFPVTGKPSVLGIGYDPNDPEFIKTSSRKSMATTVSFISLILAQLAVVYGFDEKCLEEEKILENKVNKKINTY